MKSSERDLIPPPLIASRKAFGSPESASSAERVNGEEMTKDLPTGFVNYLRSLFDILDQENRGFVKITDIERYWDANGSSFSGVLDSLKIVAPSNGLLNFEHLCRGLKLAIRSSNTKVNTSTRKGDVKCYTEYTSDSSEDSFRVHDDSKETELSDKYGDLQRKSSSREQLDSVPVNLSNSNLTHIKSNSTSKVYFVGKDSGSSDGLRGGSKPSPPSIDKKTRSSQVEEEVEILRNGLTVIEKARKWYFRRLTAVQEEKLHLQQSDQTSLEQFQYEMLLHNNRRKELSLNEASFRCYKRNIEELNDYIAKLVENPLEPLQSPKPVEAPKPPPDYVQQLRDETYAKSNRIAQLEREKSALIRDLFNAKATITGSGTNIPPDK